MKKFILTMILILAVMALLCGCNKTAQENATATTSSQGTVQQGGTTTADNIDTTESTQYIPEHTDENEMEIITISPDADAQEPTVYQTEPDAHEKETENNQEASTVIELPFIPVI